MRELPADVVRDLAQPVVGQLGLQLIDVNWHPRRGGSTLRVTVDRPGGVTIDDCGEASAAISALLDRCEQLLPDNYALEVSSPGAERRICSEAEYAAALGRKVRLTLRDGEALTVVEGRLVGVGDAHLELELRRPKSGRLQALRVSRDAVMDAQVVVSL